MRWNVKCEVQSVWCEEVQEGKEGGVKEADAGM